MPISPTSAAPARAGTTRIGSASAARISAASAPTRAGAPALGDEACPGNPPPGGRGEGKGWSVAATSASADARAAARRFLGGEGLLDRLRRSRIGLEGHVFAREVAALVRGHGRATAGAKRAQCHG